MFRRTMLIAAAATALAAPAAWTQSAQLTAAEIRNLLAGNTIVGTWGGNAYSQYYAEDGVTVYVPANGKPDEGRWRVNNETDEYESWWQSTGWTPYAMVRTSEGYAWLNGDRREPFDVREGKRVDL